jgi:hypothetical protein
MLVFSLLLSVFLDPPNLVNKDNVIFPYNRGFAIMTEDSIFYTEDGDEFTSRSHQFGLDLYRMRPINSISPNDSIQYFVSAGIGVTYKFANDTLTRIDNSYRWQSRYGAATTAFDHKIYSSGGYGEHSYHNNIIVFDEEFREWSLAPIVNNTSHRSTHKLIYYDTLTNELYTGLGDYTTFINQGIEKRESDYEIYKFDLKDNSIESWGSVEVFVKQHETTTEEDFSLYDNFYFFDLPMMHSTKGIWTFDLKNKLIYEYTQPDFLRLSQYSQILAYNKKTNNFLMASNYTTDFPRYNVVNQIDLFGPYYKEISYADPFVPSWAYVVIGVVLLLSFPLFRKSTQVSLIELIKTNERRIQQRLSTEDFFILKTIVDAFPNTVEYPELQNSYEKDLSYESRIKKLRASIKEMDTVVQETIRRRRSSIFEIDKGLEDKRVKVIRIKDDSFKQVNFFGRFKPRQSKEATSFAK